jgi:hypothetical protein
VSTELEVRERPECFPGAMSRLLQLAAHSGSPGQVHALNILRALFRSSQLGEHVAPHVAAGFSVALQAFRGDTWAVSYNFLFVGIVLIPNLCHVIYFIKSEKVIIIINTYRYMKIFHSVVAKLLGED